ncbi:hypothetical protein [Oceanicella sp. SM1341]|uniref:hypothetical protein n=1 Tax=Oceanicella sp. SM1341 TaxID=1548889 RepID=UPI000E46E74D|nr:hypothetical protein [Oceanicella sp. SM1341]
MADTEPKKPVLAFRLARAEWMTDMRGKSKEEREADWELTHKDRIMKARKILRVLDKKGFSLIQVEPEAEAA